MKKLISILLTCLFTAALLCVPAAAATLNTVETQFTYSTANPAWLKDMTVKEDMTTPQGSAASLTLTAKPEYPYSQTPEGFRTEVNYYVQLYSLDENSQKAAYLYVLQYVNQFASEATRNVSDEYIMEYLTEKGISYPQGGLGDYENLIFARALYTLLSTNAVSVSITPGMTVQAALVQCMTQVFNIDSASLAKWSNSTVDTIDEYVIVACKIALNTNGYPVDRNTPDSEVYRLTAVMMIRQLGISINEETATFDEIKIKYLAALLGKQYDISLDPNTLQTALNNNEVPLYLLKVMGKDASITIRSTMGYSEAFTAVASGTDHFQLESGEFYADIYQYEVHLAYRRSRIWICPQVYRTSSATETVMLQVNGESAASGSYVECALDSSLASQDIPITVTYQSPSQTVSKTYTVTVRQGTQDPPENGSSSIINNGNSLITIIGNNTVNALTDSFYSVSSALPARVTNIISLMVPDINTPGSSAGGQTSQGGDYLSLLMNTSAGTISYDTAAGSPITGTGLSGVGGFTSYGAAGGMGIRFEGDSLTGTALQEGTPMLASQAGAPPEGYEYLTDSNGYITGIVKSVHHAGANTTSSGKITFAMVRAKLPYVLIPMAVAAVVIAVVLAVQKKEHSRRKKTEQG